MALKSRLPVTWMGGFMLRETIYGSLEKTFDDPNTNIKEPSDN